MKIIYTPYQIGFGFTIADDTDLILGISFLWWIIIFNFKKI